MFTQTLRVATQHFLLGISNTGNVDYSELEWLIRERILKLIDKTVGLSAASKFVEDLSAIRKLL